MRVVYHVPMRILTATLFLAPFLAFSQEHPAPKNLKILKPDHLIETMRAFNSALGVKCQFCHVEGDFASDEKHHKVVARQMLEMTMNINEKFEPTEGKVRCFTCHRGANEPTNTPGAAPEHDHDEHKGQ